MMDEWWNVAAVCISENGEEVCRQSTRKNKGRLEIWWWNDEAEKAVKSKKDRMKKWKHSGLENHEAEFKST